MEYMIMMSHQVENVSKETEIIFKNSNSVA